jgi:hypothetical protein
MLGRQTGKYAKHLPPALASAGFLMRVH